MKSHAVMRMKVIIIKVICPDFSRNVLDGCGDYHDKLPLVYPDMNLTLCQPQDLPCLSLVLIHMEFIIGVIESACPRFLLPNPDTLLRKSFEAFDDIDVRIESIICAEGPTLWEVTNHL